MSHLKFPALAALLLLATPPQDSHNFTRAEVALSVEKPAGSGPYQSATGLPSNAWRGLVPLKSTRADVERLLGTPTRLVAGGYSYETKEEKVRVLYSEGSCKPSLEGQWKVPVDTMLSITVFPQISVLVSSLHLDNKIYKRSQEVHPENWAWYVSAKTGLMIHVMKKENCEEVMSITYQPTTKDAALRCPTNAKMPGKNA